MYKQPTIYKSGSVYNLDGGSGSLDNFEVPKQLAIVGDEVYAASNGTVHYIRTSTLDTASIPEGWEYVGTVALRDREKLTIIYKTENTSVKWASMWLFKVNGLKLDGTDSFVLQQGPATGSTPVEVGTFTASAAATDLDTLVDELDDWLRENNTAEGALANYNWHAEKHEDANGVDACFIVVDNFAPQSRFSPIKSSASGASAQLYMRNFGKKNASEYFVRKDGVTSIYVLWSDEEFKLWGYSVGATTDSLTNKGILSESAFNATMIIKSAYGTYQNYLDNMYIDTEADSGAYAVFKDTGKEVCENLSPVAFKNISGTDTNVFTAEKWASGLKAHSLASVDGLNEGDFFIPSVETAFEILSKMKHDGSDVVNTSLQKATGSHISTDAPRWLPCYYDSVNTWYFREYGMTNTGSTFSMKAIAVAEIDL